MTYTELLTLISNSLINPSDENYSKLETELETTQGYLIPQDEIEARILILETTLTTLDKLN
jgi:hypothetical protein